MQRKCLFCSSDFSVQSLRKSPKYCSLACAFWARVSVSGENDCWRWTAGIDAYGYGIFQYNRVHYKAHRASYELHSGRPPNRNKCVCHECDNTTCVNPAHLFIGSHADNMADMSRKGRGNWNKARGERHRNAKLTEADICAIREDNRRLRDIAADFGVGKSTIFSIRKRQTWQHIA